MGAPQANDKDDSFEDDARRIRVYFRLRPMNNLERSRRSKDCVELHDDPKILTVDAPLQGEYDFSCDMVFDEGATQEEVYHEAVSSVPRRLLEGMNCTVLAYGQTGTGKTHTMVGEGHGAEMNARTKIRRREQRLEGDSDSNSSSSDRDEAVVAAAASASSSHTAHGNDNSEAVDPAQTEGLIPRTITDVFERMAQEPKSVEFIVRCSFVEIYLEKICDLLDPSNQGVSLSSSLSSSPLGSASSVSNVTADGLVHIQGASEVCCVEPLDVFCLLARGQAYRTQSSTSQNADSSRSHALVTLQIIRTDKATGTQRTSRLQMLDLAGSELARTKSSRQIETAVMAEGKMINQSLLCLSNMIRATLAQQASSTDRTSVHPDRYANSSKLAKLLQPCFGGKVFTTMICTASPSSYNIGETINTIRFAQRVQKVQNSPAPQNEITVNNCRQKLSKSEHQVKGLTGLVRSLALECSTMRKQLDGDDEAATTDNNKNSKLWNIINQVTDLTASESSTDDENDNDPSMLHIEIKNKLDTVEHETNPNDNDVEFLREELATAVQAREKTENATRDLISEVTALRSQNEILIKDKQKLESDLNDAKTEIRSLTTRSVELEHNLRTSQFRENEATTFLRQFRSFYLRLLKHKAAKGNAETSHIYAEELSKKIPGVPEIEDLIDIDTLMMASGLIEENEVGQDTNAPEYSPSPEALARSSNEAEQSGQREMELVKAAKTFDRQQSNNGHGANGERNDFDGPLSIVNRQETAQLASYRQKLVQSPAGLLAMKKEKELERELLELSSKVINLQNAVNAEKAMVEAMSTRQGALTKIKTAQEMNTLRQELERKTNDLQAIVLKMNELHLVNKTFDEKVDNRERHVSYLEEHLSDLQSRNRRLVMERQEAEKRLRDENVYLHKLLDGLSVQVWQLEDTPSTHKKLRFLLPFNASHGSEATTAVGTDSAENEPKLERRFSLGDAIDELDIPEFPEMVTTSIQTDEPNLNTVKTEYTDCFVQTEPPPESVEMEVQTDAPNVCDNTMQTEEVEGVEFSMQTDPPDTAEFSIQTEAVEQVEFSMQTDPPPTVDMDIQTDPPPTTCEIETQTDAPPTTGEIEMQTDPPPTTSEMEIQTDEQEVEEEVEEKEPPAEGVDCSTQTEFISDTLEMSIQTEEVEEEKAETVEMSIQTDEVEEPVEPEPPKVEAAEIAIQTEDGETSDQRIQTDDEEPIPQPEVNEMSIQTDEMEEPVSVTKDLETATAATQTEEEEADLRIPGSDIAVQTDDLPHVIDVAEARSVDTGSLADSTINQATTVSKQSVKNSSTHTESNLEGSMSSIGERWKPSRPSSLSQNTKSEGDSDDSLATSNIKQLKNKYMKGSAGPIPDPASAFAKLGSSASSLQMLRTPVQKDSKFVSRASIGKLPLSQQGNDASTPVAAQRRSAKDVAESDLPEWMSKRKEMRGKLSDDKKSSHSHQKSKFKSNDRAVRKSEVVERVAPSLSPKRSPRTLGKHGPSIAQLEWMQKQKALGKRIEDDSSSTGSSENETKSPVTVPKPPAKDEARPEWMTKFQQIGMKGEETVIEASGTAQLILKPAEEEAVVDDGQPEWMRKFKQIGQKGQEEVVTADLPDGMYESDFDEEELERMRKEKKARKKERKAMKKAKKKQERRSSMT